MTLSRLPFPKRRVTVIHRLVQDLLIDQWIVPADTSVTLRTTDNFGYCILPEGCMDKRGFTVPRRIFRV